MAEQLTDGGFHNPSDRTGSSNTSSNKATSYNQSRFSITTLLGEINRNGFGRLLIPAHFYVTITPPTVLKSNYAGMERTIPLICESATLPGVGFSMQEIQMAGYGIAENRPVKASYKDFTLTFMCDAKADIIRFFHAWVQNMYNMNGDVGTKVYNGMALYDFAYPENYEATINIYQFDPRGNQVMKYDIKGAFPSAIEETTLNWAQGSEYLKIDVTFTYNYWATTGFSLGTTDVSTLGNVTSMTGKDAAVSPAHSGSHD